MASRRVNLSQRCFCVMSGATNTLSKSLAVEMCRRFLPGSVMLLIDDTEETLQEIKKEIQFLENEVEVICFSLDNWQCADAKLFNTLLSTVLNKYAAVYGKQFELALVLHNEGLHATSSLMEPQDAASWQSYVQQNLNAAVALNQQFLQSKQLADIEKLVVNIKSSLMVQPLSYSTLMCSCMKARDMYFRAMADYECKKGVSVLSYAPGILETHAPQFDLNNNVIDLQDLAGFNEKLLKLPRVRPMESTLKLISILEDMSFICGHDIDYYDTFFL